MPAKFRVQRVPRVEALIERISGDRWSEIDADQLKETLEALSHNSRRNFAASKLIPNAERNFLYGVEARVALRRLFQALQGKPGAPKRLDNVGGWQSDGKGQARWVSLAQSLRENDLLKPALLVRAAKRQAADSDDEVMVLASMLREGDSALDSLSARREALDLLKHFHRVHGGTSDLALRRLCELTARQLPRGPRSVRLAKT